MFQLAVLLEYVAPEDFREVDQLMLRIDKMLTGLIRSLSKNKLPQVVRA
jgi:hypothetical protein